MKKRFLILAIAIDHLMLALLTLGRCHRGETLSAAAWSLERDGRLFGRLFRPVIDWLFTWIERDHCAQSYLAEWHMYRGAP